MGKRKSGSAYRWSAPTLEADVAAIATEAKAPRRKRCNLMGR
jgi:hypothetical protein